MNLCYKTVVKDESQQYLIWRCVSVLNFSYPVYDFFEVLGFLGFFTISLWQHVFISYSTSLEIGWQSLKK